MKKGKKLLQKLLASTVAVTLLAGSGLATTGSAVFGVLTANAVGSTIVSSGKCGDNVTYTLDSEGTLIIEGTGDMYDYDYYYHNEGPFSRSDDIKKIIIKNSITSIGSDVFYDCSRLTSIEIPDSVTNIGKQAFHRCSSLTSIEIPDSVTSIGEYAFWNCDSLTSIEIPDSVTSIGEYAFGDCGRLTSIEIPDSLIIVDDAFDQTKWYDNQPNGVVYIGKCLYAYKGEMPQNTKIVIKEGTVQICGGAFSKCSSLTSIKIPDSVTSIGDEAFNKCSSLQSIEIPDSVTHIGDYAFYETKWYDNQPDGVIYAGKCLYKYKGEMPQNTKIVIKEGTIQICDDAFSSCSSLTNIKIPDSVTSIGERAFCGCSSLTNIKIPDSVTSIGSSAFEYCSSLTSIEIPDSVTSIGGGAFDCCSSLTSIKIPYGVTSIENHVFYDCSGLTSIEIPDSVTSINGWAFNGCTALKDVYYSGTKEEWGKISISRSKRFIGLYCYQSNEDLFNSTFHYSSHYVPETVKSGKIGNLTWTENEAGTLTISGKGDMPDFADKTSPFYGRTFTEIVIEDGVTGIGAYAFQSQSPGPMFMTIADSVTKINAHAFDGNDGYAEISAKGVTEIGEAAFKNCKNFTFKLSDGLKTIGKEAFYGCKKISEFSVPDSVETIGAYAYNGSGIVDVNWPSHLRTIGEGVFANCVYLNSIKLPSTVTKIEKNAFNNCIADITVSYDGFKEDWNQIIIESGNDALKKAKLNRFEIGQTLEEELLEKTKLYTSDGGQVYKNVQAGLTKKLIDSSISQEDKIEMLHRFYNLFNITDMHEGTEYCTQATKAKKAFDYLTTNDVFLAHQFKDYLQNTPKGTVARGLMITDGWLFNNEIKQYIDPETYLTGETVDIKNYKAMLLSFMNYKADDSAVAPAKDVVSNADKVRKYIEKLIVKMDESAQKNIKKDLYKVRVKSSHMTNAEVKTEMQRIWNKYKLTDTIENNKRAYHIQGFEELAKSLKISGKLFKITSTGLDDFIELTNVESRLETIEQYRKFLELVANGNGFLPNDLVIAANQLLKEIVEPYQKQFFGLIYDMFDCTDSVLDVSGSLKKKITEPIKETLKSKYPKLFIEKGLASTFGEALGTIKISATIVDALTSVGATVKDAAYVEAYAYLGEYFTYILNEKKDQFNKNQTVDNAWEFYDIYHLLFRIRACGENSYLKMCDESSITKILSFCKFKYFDIADRKQYVKDTFEYMNNECFFGLENAGEIPEMHKFAQKALIKCPVDIEVYDSSGNLVYTVFDGKTQDVTNDIGRFICQYDSKQGDYIKVVYLNNSDSYTLKAVGKDSGNVSIETAKVTSNNTVDVAKITGLPIEKNGIIVVNTDTNDYQDDRYGDSSKILQGKMQSTIEDSIIDIQSLSLTEKSLSIKKGNKKSIGVIINPVNATYSNVMWSSSDESIATVKGGVIAAISLGTVEITAETYDGKYIASCTVSVEPAGVLGDTNNDGSVDIADALMIARYDAGLVELDSSQLSVSDVNKDNSVDIADALMIARYDIGLIETLE